MKNFTNNFKQFTSRLSARWLIMALMLLLGTSSAWAATIYFDNSNTQWSKINLCVGKSSWSEMNISMTHVCGNIYKADVGSWDATELSFYDATNYSSGWGSESGSISHRYGWLDYPATAIKTGIGGNISNANDKVYTALLETTTVTTGNDNNKVKTVYKLSSTVLTYSESLCCTPPNAPELTNPAAQCGGSITLPATYNNEFTLNWYDENGNVVDNTTITSSGTYYAAAVGECESTDRTAYIVTINPVPSITNVGNVTLCSSSTPILVAELIAETKATASNSATIGLYDGNGVEITSPININTQTTTTTTYKLKASTQTCSSDFVEFTLRVNPLPAAPSLTSPAPVCEGTTVNLPTGFNWYNAETGGTEVQNTAITATGTYWAAAVENGCESATRARYDVAVNPLPNISISGNNSAVLYEDVELTATTDGTSISWEITGGDGSLSSTTGNSVTLTSSSAGNVTVTATATSTVGCTSATTKTVTFSAENCAPVASNDIEITFTHPADIQTKGQWWGMGTMYYSTNNTSWSSKKMHEDCATSGSVTFTLTDVATSTIYVYFEACYDWGYGGDNTKKATTVNDIITLNRGKKYSITITNGDINATATATVTGSLTQDPEITAPAVKMISAEYDEENDVIVAKGAVYKTGCDVTFWGFQYSEDGQPWGTADADFIRPSTGNSLSVPGEFDYSFPIPDANGGETYYIRAYALNNYKNDNYNLSSAVYSTTSLPVEIPSKTIESATISLVDREGDPLDVTEVCPQSTVYLKVSYVGGDFTDFVAEEDFPGTDLELENHDKTNNYAIFSFTATAAGTANITISNKSGSTVTPAEGVSITLKDVQVVTPPIITINPESAMICQGDDATISIVEENQNYTYTIYKDGEALNPQSFTITEAGVYTVGATENECNTSATSMPIELKVVSSDVKIGLEADNTAIGPWQPLKLTVTPAKGYEYTLEGLDGMVYTKEGDVYTIKIPRPNDWSPGNSGTQLETENKVFTAKIKVSDEVSCGSKEVTVTLTDTEENCE